MAAYTTGMQARFIDEHDPQRCAELMAAMAASDTWWTPTLQVLRMGALAGNRQFREDPRRRYIPYIVRAGIWEPDADSAAENAAQYESGRRHEEADRSSGLTASTRQPRRSACRRG